CAQRLCATAETASESGRNGCRRGAWGRRPVNGLDTNVLIRYIVQDDAAQAAAATKLIQNRCTRQTPGFVSHLVLAEITWVLHRGYGYGRGTIEAILAGLLSSVELQVQEPAIVWRALQAFRKGN